ncbi:DUF2332 domain-containing protein [Oleisolibacter albus]|uniref:DUF2332 domain-containing protein n=1 Tax=Oleisolibacter albus TaxID=2171757 RepID=UPI000DF371C9|nr:DUF2332 domain-containing protein [Oleisolibacter albus]
MSSRVVDSFRTQIGWCRTLGSPFTAALLEQALADLERGGPVAALLGDWPGDPTADALPLRLAGAAHALVLSGASPALAACYPPQAETDRVGAVLAAEIASRPAWFRAVLRTAPQTNEARRSVVLLGGFLTLAAETGLPLRLLEIGASAGLLQHWDRFRYRLGDAVWGPANAGVQVITDWSGPLPPLDAVLTIASRAACDRDPVDLASDEAVLRLRAYVWADQTERAALLDAAIAQARTATVQVEAADAADWVEARLAEPVPDQLTVLYHTIVWQYLPEATKDRILTALEHYGARAPLAHLAFELSPEGGPPALTLSVWPDRRRRVLAHAHPHGAAVTWLAG